MGLCQYSSDLLLILYLSILYLVVPLTEPQTLSPLSRIRHVWAMEDWTVRVLRSHRDVSAFLLGLDILLSLHVISAVWHYPREDEESRTRAGCLLPRLLLPLLSLWTIWVLLAHALASCHAPPIRSARRAMRRLPGRHLLPLLCHRTGDHSGRARITC